MSSLSAHDYVFDSKSMEILNIYYILCAGCCAGVEGLGTEMKDHGIESDRVVRQTWPEMKSKSYAKKFWQISEV